MTIAVIDYGIGNLHSAQKALRSLGADAVLTDSSAIIKNSSAVVLPGVGNFGACMSALRERGLDADVDDVVASGKPFLGICVGMQMLFDSSEEAPGVPGLGILPGVGNFGACMSAIRERGLDVDVDDAVASGKPFLGICVGMQMLFDSSEEAQGVSGLGIIPGVVSYLPSDVRRPQMQWNELIVSRNDPVLSGEGEPQWVYFVHSLAAQPEDVRHVAATVNYGGATTAACRHENVLAMQFHPEKSGTTGLAMLNRWLSSEGVVS